MKTLILMVILFTSVTLFGGRQWLLADTCFCDTIANVVKMRELGKLIGFHCFCNSGRDVRISITKEEGDYAQFYVQKGTLRWRWWTYKSAIALE